MGYSFSLPEALKKDNNIIGRGYNQVEKMKDSTYHAELIAIREAINFTGYKIQGGG